MTWPFSAPNPAGRRGRFRGYSFLAGCDEARRFMTDAVEKVTKMKLWN
jgi:hypothetical protein